MLFGRRSILNTLTFKLNKRTKRCYLCSTVYIACSILSTNPIQLKRISFLLQFMSIFWTVFIIDWRSAPTMDHTNELMTFFFLAYCSFRCQSISKNMIELTCIFWKSAFVYGNSAMVSFDFCKPSQSHCFKWMDEQQQITDVTPSIRRVFFLKLCIMRIKHSMPFGK